MAKWYTTKPHPDGHEITAINNEKNPWKHKVGDVISKGEHSSRQYTSDGDAYGEQQNEELNPIVNRYSKFIAEQTRKFSFAIPVGQRINEATGIPTERRAAIAEGLSRLLADSYTLYLKTQNYHWNVTGPMFQELHAMFSTQYTDLGEAVDGIAERIRALGHPAPGSFAAFARLTTIKEEDSVPASLKMVANLVTGHETLVRTAREVFRIAEAANDGPTCDLLIQRMQVSEKTLWMLRSMLAPA